MEGDLGNLSNLTDSFFVSNMACTCLSAFSGISKNGNIICRSQKIKLYRIRSLKTHRNVVHPMKVQAADDDCKACS